MPCRALALCTSSHLIITPTLVQGLIIIPILLISKVRQRKEFNDLLRVTGSASGSTRF